MKKKLLFILFTVFCVFNVFCYEGNIVGGLDGTFTRYEFIQLGSNKEYVFNMLDPKGEYGIQRFFLITEDTVDEEDASFLDDIEVYINKNFNVKENESYSFLVLRNNTETFMDGWVVLYHYAPKNKTPHLYYLYYFSTEE